MALLVSNDAYRLGTMIGAGTRPRLDAGVLGIAALTAAPRRGAAPPVLALAQWSTPTFTVESDGPVPAGIDGEAVILGQPVRFESRPGALRVRIARAHPGASPSTEVPRGLPRTIAELTRIALGRAHPRRASSRSS